MGYHILNMQAVTRRGFLVTCLAAMSPVAAGEDRPTYIYAGESFSGEMGAPLIVGCLWTVKPAEHLPALRNLRRGARFSGKFFYHSGDRYKAGYARELCHYFAHDPDLRFAASVVYSSRRAETFPEAFRRNEYCELVSRMAIPHTAVLRARARKTVDAYRKPKLRGNDWRAAGGAMLYCVFRSSTSFLISARRTIAGNARSNAFTPSNCRPTCADFPRMVARSEMAPRLAFKQRRR
jgi:hypothetical protein